MLHKAIFRAFLPSFGLRHVGSIKAGWVCSLSSLLLQVDLTAQDTHTHHFSRKDGNEEKKKEGKVKRPHSPAGRPPKLAKLAAPYPGGRRRSLPGGQDEVPREVRRSAAGDEARAPGQVGWVPFLRRSEDARTQRARRGCVQRQPERCAGMTADKGIASFSGSGRSDASRRGGRRQAPRREGRGRSAEPWRRV